MYFVLKYDVHMVFLVDMVDESIKVIVSIPKMLLHDYIKLLNMLLHPSFHDLKFLLDNFSLNRISLYKC